MSNSTEYLTSSIIKNDSWVKRICSASTADEVESLIMSRLTDPRMHGPVVAYAVRMPSLPEKPAEIVYDLVINSFADYDLCNEAMCSIMEKVLKKEINPDADVMENIFHIIEQLVLSDCADNLYEWIKANIDDLNSNIVDKRRTLLNGVGALAYIQKPEAKLGPFWLGLWEQSNPYWWNTAFLGLRYSDLDKALELLPQLIERKCSNLTFLLHTIWRMKEDPRMANLFKAAIKENDAWVGIAINHLAFKMKWAEKDSLIRRLYDPNVSLSTEEEDHMETMGYGES